MRKRFVATLGLALLTGCFTETEEEKAQKAARQAELEAVWAEAEIRRGPIYGTVKSIDIVEPPGQVEELYQQSNGGDAVLGRGGDASNNVNLGRYHLMIHFDPDNEIFLERMLDVTDDPDLIPYPGAAHPLLLSRRICEGSRLIIPGWAERKARNAGGKQERYTGQNDVYAVQEIVIDTLPNGEYFDCSAQNQ